MILNYLFAYKLTHILFRIVTTESSSKLLKFLFFIGLSFKFNKAIFIYGKKSYPLLKFFLLF